LNFITVGRSIALAIPCGVSYTAPNWCAIEWTIPRPTFENPIPAIYWAIAIISTAFSSFSFTAFGKLSNIIFIAFIWNISDISLWAFVIYPSTACVKASIPVEAAIDFGIEAISSESTIAIIGISCGSTQTIFTSLFSSVIT